MLGRLRVRRRLPHWYAVETMKRWQTVSRLFFKQIENQVIALRKSFWNLRQAGEGAALWETAKAEIM